MKRSFAVALIITAFIAVAVLARISLRSEINETNNAVETLQNDLRRFVASIDETCAFDNLVTSICNPPF